jgi:hypothetical protein
MHLSDWRIENPPKYYKALCPCPEKHRTTVHITPSSRDYLNNKRQHLESSTCFNEPGRKSDGSDSNETDF